MLDSMNCCEHKQDLFCKKCYGRVHGPKGIGWGIGAGILTMDAGEHFGNTETNMTNRPLTGEAFCAPGMDSSAPMYQQTVAPTQVPVVTQPVMVPDTPPPRTGPIGRMKK